MLSPFPWRAVLAKFNNGIPLALASLATGIGSIIPLILGNWLGVILSALIFGVSFFIAPTAVTAFSKKNLPQNQWGTAIALYTSIFAIGQTLGPIGAGWLSDVTGDLTYGLIAGASILVCGCFFALFQKSIKS